MNIVVTGATSFVGAATVKALLEQGGTVYAVVRPGSKNLSKLPDADTLNKKDQSGDRQYPGALSFIENDLSCMEQLPERINNQCDIFLHFGWGGSGSDSRKDNVLQQQNVKDSITALEAARRLGCRRFIFSGSQAEYGLHETLMTEESPCSPLSAYGEAKLLVGSLAREKCREYGMDYVHTRIFSVYGPGDHPWSLVSTCTKGFLNGDSISLGDCTSMWNFLYIEDLAKAMVSLAMYEGVLMDAGSIYNLAGSHNDTRILKNFVETMYELCGQKGNFQYGVRPPNAEGQINLIPDISKIERVTGWHPNISFEQGITKLLRTYENVKEL